jgi:hypothetical protein
MLSRPHRDCGGEHLAEIVILSLLHFCDDGRRKLISEAPPNAGLVQKFEEALNQIRGPFWGTAGEVLPPPFLRSGLIPGGR